MKAGIKVRYKTGKRLGQIVWSSECSCENVLGREDMFLKVLLAGQWGNDDTNLKKSFENMGSEPKCSNHKH